MSGWRDVVRSVAPTIATALGGPLAGAATAALSDKLLGKPDASQQDIQKVLEGTLSPDNLLKLKQAEQDFQAKMAEIGVDLERIAEQDRESARNRQVALKDWVPSALALALAASFFVLLFLMLTRTIPDANKDAFNILLGMLGGSLATVMTYYFGSSSGSAKKDETLAKALQSK